MINHGDLEEYVNGYFICLSLLFCSWFLYYIAKKILRQADKVGDTIQHVRVQRKRWYDHALFQDESTPPDDAPAWTISSSYNRDSHTRGEGGGSGRQNEQEGGGGSGSGHQIEQEGGSGSGRVQRKSGSRSGRQDERDVGSESGSGQRESGGGSSLINQNEEERGGGSGKNRRLLVEGSGQTEEPRRDKGKGTGISSISNILNP